MARKSVFKDRKVLVTGGLGYIGSHTVVLLQQNGFDVVIIDDLSNSSLDVLEAITKITGKKPTLELLDLKDKKGLESFFDNHPDLFCVIHFAAHKSVSESVDAPLKYYTNNLVGLTNLLECLENRKEVQFIFSSSCTVYGEADELPITELAPIKEALSPYGNTKQIGEEIIRDFANSTSGFDATLLRYFNPIGAHHTGLIGERPNGVPQNLLPYLMQTALGLRESLSVFGGDYNTLDGSAIRDYIHVIDLAEAHIVCLKRLIKGENVTNIEIFNIGTGKGVSVLEMIETFKEVTNKEIPYQIVDRRAGDVQTAYADISKAEYVLDWHAKRPLSKAIRDAWKWENNSESK